MKNPIFTQKLVYSFDQNFKELKNGLTLDKSLSCKKSSEVAAKPLVQEEAPEASTLVFSIPCFDKSSAII